jgi:DNA-directed RNA polymerase subunit RPC12/RpoP
MSELGWAVRLPPAGYAGMYCYDCSQLLELLRRSLECAECGQRVADEDAADRDGWRYFHTKSGPLTPYCAECSEELYGV